MSTTHTDAEMTNTLFDSLGDYAPEVLSADERHRIESDIRSLREGIAEMDTQIACCSCSFRTWCIEVRAQMRQEVAMLWQRLEA